MLRLGNIRDGGGMINSWRCTWTPLLLPPPSLSPLRVITRSCEIAAHPAFSLYFICTLSSLEMGREDLAGVKERPLLPLTLYPKPCAAKGNGPWRAINFVLVEHLTPWKFPSVFLFRERYFPQIIPLDYQQCISYPSLCKKKEKVQFSSGDNSSSSINEGKIHRTSLVEKIANPAKITANFATFNLR